METMTMKHNAAHYLTLIVSVILVILATTTLTGCVSLDQRDTNQDGVVDRDEAASWYESKLETARSINTEYTGFVDTLNAQIDELYDAIGQSEPNSSEQAELIRARDKLIEWRDKAQGVADEASSTIQRFTDLLENMPDDWDNSGAVDGAFVGEAVKTVAPFLPPPWNALVIGVAGLAPVLGKKIYDLRNERNTLIYSIDEVKREDPDFAKALDRNSKTIRAVQGMKLAKKFDKIRSPVADKFEKTPTEPPPDMRH